MNDDQLAAVRRFNRLVTQRIGALDGNYLGSGRALGEARLLFEIGEHGETVRALRARLGLDSGYLSRLLRVLEADGLVRVRPDAADGRVRRVSLTVQGKREWEALDKRSKELASSLLAPLGASQRARLLAAMAEVERLLRASAVTIETADPFSPEARHCIDAYFRELEQRFDEGFDPERSVPAMPGELVPPAGCLLVARLDGAAVGCAALKLKGHGYGEIKRMWVTPDARGLGIAQRLLEALEARALAAGVEVLQLDTHHKLGEARELYRRNGYQEIAAYNDNPYAHHWFEKRDLQRAQ
jgi:DNA-binding MarR family transcriptional regulator/GNAT superfamily N-acetyltransferase